MSERDRTDLTDLTDDQFLRRLAAADPIDPSTLPSAEAPEAARLLEHIVDRDAAASAEVPRPQGPSVTAVPGSRDRSGWSSRGRRALLAVAAALIVLVGAVTVLAPDATPAALAEVHDAAATTADADTGRIESTFALRYVEGDIEETAGGRVEIVYSDGDLGLSVSLADLPDEFGPEVDDLLPALDDIRLVDDVAYVQRDGQWLAVETGGVLGDLVVRYVDPRTVLDTVQTLTETTEIGPVDLDGVAATRYQSVVDLGDETLAQSGWLAFDGMAVEADGRVTIDLYVDDAGMLRRFDLSGEVRPGDGQPGQGTFEVVTSFSDIGADLTVEAPADAELIDPMAAVMGDDEE